MKRAGRACRAFLGAALLVQLLAMNLWDDRAEMMADLREVKRRWISPGHRGAE